MGLFSRFARAASNILGKLSDVFGGASDALYTASAKPAKAAKYKAIPISKNAKASGKTTVAVSKSTAAKTQPKHVQTTKTTSRATTALSKTTADIRADVEPTTSSHSPAVKSERKRLLEDFEYNETIDENPALMGFVNQWGIWRGIRQPPKGLENMTLTDVRLDAMMQYFGYDDRNDFMEFLMNTDAFHEYEDVYKVSGKNEIHEYTSDVKFDNTMHARGIFIDAGWKRRGTK